MGGSASGAPDGTAMRIPTSATRADRDWRIASPFSARQHVNVLLVAILSAGGGLTAALWLSRTVPQEQLVSLLALWFGLLSSITYWLVRRRAPTLLSIRASDLLWGVSTGLALRLIQGGVSNANSATFPAAGSELTLAWWVDTFVATGIIAPVIEEFFFRGVVFVTVFALFQRRAGVWAAAVAASFASGAFFLLMHLPGASLSTVAGFQYLLLGLTCSMLVALSGRIWPAVITHATYNLTYVGLIAVGTVAQ